MPDIITDGYNWGWVGILREKLWEIVGFSSAEEFSLFSSPPLKGVSWGALCGLG